MFLEIRSQAKSVQPFNMAERNSRNVFILGANIREDLERMTKTERESRNGTLLSDPSFPRFEDLLNRHQDFQYFYSPAGAELKIRV